MNFLPSSERVGEADALLEEAGLKVEEYRDTLDPESYSMAEGLLQM
jgi:hypothetical protein